MFKNKELYVAWSTFVHSLFLVAYYTLSIIVALIVHFYWQSFLYIRLGAKQCPLGVQVQAFILKPGQIRKNMRRLLHRSLQRSTPLLWCWRHMHGTWGCWARDKHTCHRSAAQYSTLRTPRWRMDENSIRFGDGSHAITAWEPLLQV
jgi:hypothetical protein